MKQYVKLFILLIASMTLFYACGGSSMKSGGDQTGDAQTVYDAANYVGTETCLTCHIPGNAKFVEAYAKWSNSRHANINSDPDHSCTSGPCHNPIDLDMDTEITLPVVDMVTKLVTGYNNVDTAHRPFVGCEGCHGPGSMHATSPTTPLPMAYNESLKNGWSYQYSICTTCHQLTDDNENWLKGETQHITRQGKSRPFRVISDTHYDNPETTDIIEGYVINPTDSDACVKCHDPHYVKIDRESIPGDGYDEKDNNSIYVQWARSAHAGHILNVKEAEWEASGKTADNLSFFDVGVTDDTGPAWSHYDWDAANRQACQRCHTATGAKNFQTQLASYDPANNDFSHLAGWQKLDNGTIIPSGQNELLYCWGCHKDNAGGLNVSESTTVVDIFKALPDINSGRFFYEDTNDNTSVQAKFNSRIDAIPDLGASKTCITCHVGRTSIMLDVDRKYSDDNSLDGNSSGSSTHYLDTSGTIFKFAAYEFEGVSYDDVPYYEHNKIGIDNEFGTGYDGPCVTCHMPDASNGKKDHTFAITEDTDGDGNDDAIRANVLAVCSNCHTGQYEMTFEKLEEEKTGFENALEAMKYYIENQNVSNTGKICTKSSYPYIALFDNVSIDCSNANFFAAENNWSTVFGNEDKNAYGAAYNYVWISHEPGAFAHNRYYAKRVIFDAIDFFDNGVLDGTIDLSSYANACEWYGAISCDNVTRP
ncbi:hypothetical protein OWM07_05500 [Deferribacter thermophilus]|uniref:hypothetical protein n=1 Tax=Deferribacter thermophilus TaxID=53573 RepID=UPI003C1AC141